MRHTVLALLSFALLAAPAQAATAPTPHSAPASNHRPFTAGRRLTGTGSAHATVTLLGRAFPFTTPFAQIGNSIVSNPDGTYAFNFPVATITTQLEIKANTNPPITTAVVTMPVASSI